MEKYNKFLSSLAEIVEKGLVNSKDIKKDVKDSIKFMTENAVNRLNLVSREEFEVQKKIIEKLQKDLSNKKLIKKKTTSKTRKAKTL
tara:strand:- start:398 stop:658 length:261 start_codon:yes stop_codon:yes gene_type:complete